MILFIQGAPESVMGIDNDCGWMGMIEDPDAVA